jgi:hypothetical protein
MLLNQRSEDRLDRLTDRLRRALAPASGLVADAIVEAIAIRVLKGGGKVTQIHRLIEAGAWTDAALALIDIELPTWKLRRLVHEDGEWLCSLSRQPKLPAELDDSADARHEVLALAILSALVEARRKTGAVLATSTPTVGQVRPTSSNAICCDSFA